MSTLPVMNEHGSRFGGGPSRSAQDAGAFPALKDSGDPYFPRNE